MKLRKNIRIRAVGIYVLIFGGMVFSGYGFYLANRRPTTVTVDRPVDRVVEKQVQIPCTETPKPAKRASKTSAPPLIPPGTTIEAISNAPDSAAVGINTGNLTINPAQNPNLPVTIYDWNGTRHISVGVGNIQVDDVAVGTWNSIVSAVRRDDWDATIKLSTQAKRDYPEWLFPYFTSAIAYQNECDKDNAIANFKIFITRGKGTPQYDWIEKTTGTGPMKDSEIRLGVLEKIEGPMPCH